MSTLLTNLAWAAGGIAVAVVAGVIWYLWTINRHLNPPQPHPFTGDVGLDREGRP